MESRLRKTNAAHLHLLTRRLTTLCSSALFGPFFMSVVIGCAILRVAATYTTFSQTFDEPFHIAAGVEWLDKGTYTLELQHPPLARIAVALGPYLSGLRWPPSPVEADWRGVGTLILTTQGNYLQNLSLARAGILPFLAVACVVVFLWADRWFGRMAAVVAVLLFVCLPPVLGQAGLATTDMPATATVSASLYLLIRWFERMDWPRTFLLGIGVGAAVASKFSTIAFFAACTCVAALYVATGKSLLGFSSLKRPLFRFSAAIFVAAIFVWGTYRFSVRPISSQTHVHERLDKWVTGSWLKGVADWAVETPIPLLDLYQGVQAVRIHEELGHDSYLLGQYRKTGWWYYFPIVLVVKTPVGFILLSAAGLTAVLLKPSLTLWQRRLTAIFPILILGVCMASKINIGVRHVLPIYPPLAVLGGYAAALLLEHRGRFWISALGVLCVASVVVESVVAHPDYLAYFNPIAFSHPERVLCETDLDWGQDLFRLAERLKSLGIQRIALKYYGTAPPEVAGLTSYRELSPTVPVSGYVAISIRDLELENARDGSYGWLKSRQPLERVGRSIFLYYIP